jgi:hypothetical protein
LIYEVCMRGFTGLKRNLEKGVPVRRVALMYIGMQ